MQGVLQPGAQSPYLSPPSVLTPVTRVWTCRRLHSLTLTDLDAPWQLTALADSLAIAHLLDATLVLPSLSSGNLSGKTKVVNHYNVTTSSHSAERVPASEFLDVERLIEALKPYVEVVTELPWWLQVFSPHPLSRASLKNRPFRLALPTA